jgi:hypothetical protein
VGLKFSNQIEAWDSLAEAVTFAAEDAGTRADIACAITMDALVQHFEGRAGNIPGLIVAFRQNRAKIEEVASLKYDLQGRRGPVVLKAQDFVGRIGSPTVH